MKVNMFYFSTNATTLTYGNVGLQVNTLSRGCTSGPLKGGRGRKGREGDEQAHSQININAGAPPENGGAQFPYPFDL